MASSSAARRGRAVGFLGFVFGSVTLLWGGAALDDLSAAQAWTSSDGVVPRACSFRARTGLSCLGCGGTRALKRTARGDVRGGWAVNPLGASAGLAAWVLALGGGLASISGRLAFLKGAVLAAMVLLPLAFVWNALSWWSSLPPGSLVGP